MNEVIILSSDDSDVEFVCWRPTLSMARADWDTVVKIPLAVNQAVCPGNQDLMDFDSVDSNWDLLQLKHLKNQTHGLSESVTRRMDQEMENLPQDDLQEKTESLSTVKESPTTESRNVNGSMHSTNICTKPSPNDDSESQICITDSKMNAALDFPKIEPMHGESSSIDEGVYLSKLRQQENFNEFKDPQQSLTSSPSTGKCFNPEKLKDSDINFNSSFLNSSKTETSTERNTKKFKEEQLELEKAESKQMYVSCKLSPDDLNASLKSAEHYKSDFLIQNNLAYPCVKSEYEQITQPKTDNTPGWLVDCETYSIESVSPVSFLELESNEVDMNGESRLNQDFSVISREDKQFVSPGALKKVMAGAGHFLVDDHDVSFGAPVELCRESLSLVYITIEENYTEGTLQLLSDLIQPFCHLPKDITSHLLRDILLNPECPHDLSVVAFNLLMKEQRHHMADIYTIAWDWELLTSVMDDQDASEGHRCEVVRMLLEYVLQTIEDDFQAKHSTSSLYQSIAKATLSCDRQFPRVQDIIRWLLCDITKTEPQSSKKSTKEREEQLRKVPLFQRMLSIALEVDRSPALNCAKLSQELYQMLLNKKPLRVHRMLLLKSLQSTLLRCKVLEHLLNYASPPIFVPVSLSLLLHYLKNCKLKQDPTDGTEKWQKWEELIQLLWMLLHSYDHAMKTCLSSTLTQHKPQSSRPTSLFYKPHDKISKPAVNEAVEAFLSRSQEDLGEPLPVHVEELLTYLQDHLLDVCQC